MENPLKLSTISFDPDLRQALQLRAEETGRSISELVNQAVRLFPAEDIEDIAAFEERALGGFIAGGAPALHFLSRERSFLKDWWAVPTLRFLEDVLKTPKKRRTI